MHERRTALFNGSHFWVSRPHIAGEEEGCFSDQFAKLTRTYLYKAKLSPVDTVADGGQGCYSQQDKEEKAQDAQSKVGVAVPGP